METSTSKDRDMLAAAQTDLRLFAAGAWPTMNHKGRLRQLCRALPAWTSRRVRAVYNGEIGVTLRADEQADIERITGEAKNEHRDLAQLAASLQALLFGPEADFYRPQVDAIRAALVPQGGGIARGGAADGSGDSGRSAAGHTRDDGLDDLDV